MEIKRGDLVLAAGPGEFSGKPRPFVIVQSDSFNELHASFAMCPVTSTTNGAHLFRIAIDASIDTVLDRNSEIQIDKIQSLRRQRVVRVIGAVPANIMTMVDDALRRWLQL
ncbi:type II toxin-antitoxin system PemK/MazF family toxin [Sphingomonas oligophenolica]|uniref:Type II toxin-antitoxin system PemK/MazF family toxin n=1 Tax=Sphingomonas oligophenolica TaxID=301154 RepID=A0A502CKV2_9SPHN|nr:type II toxin-antitoxin system PemK/MazF family toxin [Sphingomonas oligophenolica]